MSFFFFKIQYKQFSAIADNISNFLKPPCILILPCSFWYCPLGLKSPEADLQSVTSLLFIGKILTRLLGFLINKKVIIIPNQSVVFFGLTKSVFPETISIISDSEVKMPSRNSLMVLLSFSLFPLLKAYTSFNVYLTCDLLLLKCFPFFLCNH